MMIRDHQTEHQNFNDRLYAYDFDYRMHHYMLRTFAPWLARGPRVLEMGCYEGGFTQLLTDHYADVTVIEAAADLITTAKQTVKKPVRFLHGLFETIELQEKFDAIFLIHTLEHLDHPIKVLKRIQSEWLSEKGLLFLVTPNAHAASRQIAVGRGMIPYCSAVTEGEYAHGHRHTYSLDLLAHHAREADLKIQQQGGVFFKPFANFQLDAMLRCGAIDEGYLEGCYQLGMRYPDLCASIFLVCQP